MAPERAKHRELLPDLPLSAAALLALLLASPAAAQSVVAPEEFARMSEGRTLHFTAEGLPFGSEQYLSGRRTLWQEADGSCLEGHWYAEGRRICFRYADDPTPHCWLLRDGAGGLSAHLVEDGAETGLTLQLSAISDEPLPCPGPEVGS